MLLAVAAIATAVAGWQQYRREDAGRALLAASRTSAPLVAIRATRPGTYPFDPNTRASLAPLLRTIRERRAQWATVRILATELARAGQKGDEPAMRASLAALCCLGPEVRWARREVLQIARGDNWSDVRRRELTLVRCSAVHVLGLMAAEDPSAVRGLVELLDDTTALDRLTAESAANELASAGVNNVRFAIPTLIYRLDEAPRDAASESYRASIVSALGRLAYNDDSVQVRLYSVIEDEQQGPMVRGSALTGLAMSILGDDPISASWRSELRTVADELSVAPDPYLKTMAEQARSQFDRIDLTLKRRAESARLMAIDRSLNGWPRPATRNEGL